MKEETARIWYTGRWRKPMAPLSSDSRAPMSLMTGKNRRDLLQEIHLQLWRSCAYFDQRCSVRTWVYRVAHNVATRHIIRESRTRSRLVSVEDLDTMPGSSQPEIGAEAEALDRLSLLIQRLKPLDRQIIVSYLEGLEARTIGEITGTFGGEYCNENSPDQERAETVVGEGEPHAR